MFYAIRSSGLWIGCKLNVTEDFNLDTYESMLCKWADDFKS